MAGPFPGMDPWLEARGIFPGFHNSFLANLKVRLNECLPDGFVADIANSVWIASPEERFIQPDVSVLRPPGEIATGSHAVGLVAQPIIVNVPRAEIEEATETTEWHLEIRTIGSNEELVTSIELLSRTNKIGGETGREAYRSKQLQLFERRIHLVEIDLLRFGRHATLIPIERLRGLRMPWDYHISVARADRADSFDVYPVRLDQPLPIVEFPLTADLPGVAVALQEIVDDIYQGGRYRKRLNYHQPCDPPLNSEQAAWASAILQSKSSSSQ